MQKCSGKKSTYVYHDGVDSKFILIKIETLRACRELQKKGGRKVKEEKGKNPGGREGEERGFSERGEGWGRFREEL